MRITRRWFSLHILWQVPFGYFCTDVVMFALRGFTMIAGERVAVVTFLFKALAALIYAALTAAAYAGIARTLFNRTIVTATSTQLSVRNPPVPGPEGWFRLRRQDLAQLVCVQVPDWFGRARWDLVATLHDGRRLTLIRHRPLEELLSIERAAEEALGIVDVPLPPQALAADKRLLQMSITDPLLPVEVRTQTGGDRLVLSWYWFNLNGLIVLGFLLLALFATLPQASGLLHGIGWSSVWVMTCTAALVYLVFALGLNRTVVSAIRGGTLAVRHGPLPLLPGVTVSARHVRQLYLHADAPGRAPHVRALLVGGRRITLAKAPNAEVAADIERSIERWLGIEDQAVPELRMPPRAPTPASAPAPAPKPAVAPKADQDPWVS